MLEKPEAESDLIKENQEKQLIILYFFYTQMIPTCLIHLI